jgi:hypothetical protein
MDLKSFIGGCLGGRLCFYFNSQENASTTFKKYSYLLRVVTFA